MIRSSRAGKLKRALALTAGIGAVVLYLRPADLAAGVIGSRHDFTNLGIAGDGACSGCHRVHWARDGMALWSRDLSQEYEFFSQQADPDYVPPPTILCYDCHVEEAAFVDDGPGDSGWSPQREPPQDIALDGTAVGYYELADGTLPGFTPPSAGSPTGGHYWKSTPTGSPAYARGDKISCALCHDPHDRNTGGNEALFRQATADGSGGTIPLGTGLKASASSRHGTGTGRQMCAACHSYADSGTPVTLWGVSLQRPPAAISDHAAGAAAPCVDCHLHNFVVPAGACEECHGQGGNVHAGLDGNPGTADDAPNVITVGGYSVWDGEWWNAVKGGSTSIQQGGHGDSGGQPALACTDCHDTRLPPGTHMDGVVNSVESGTDANTNTAHLKAGFIGTSAPESDVQVTLDNACWGCHSTQGVQYMDHDRESPANGPPGPVQLGLSLTQADGAQIAYPVDSDVSTHTNPAQPVFAPCISCHNPHGTTISDTDDLNPNASNRMLRDNWESAKDLCLGCHY